MIVAIDGPAGSGKSTIAGQLAARLGFEKLDTGAMYRAVALAALERAANLDDEAAIDELARTVRIDVARRAGARARVLLDGVDVTDEIRTPAVDACVSKVSAYPGVRRAMLDVQRRAADGHDVVAEGRDIGTVVFPAAEVKVFLTADPAERARRRVAQRHEADVDSPSKEELEQEFTRTLDAIERRDQLDSSREVAPLVPAADAVHIDSTAASIDEVVARIAALIKERR